MIMNKKQIVLRDSCSEDIEDYIRWHTTDVEWMNWDAPWEQTESVNVAQLTSNIRKRIDHPESPRKRLEISLDTGEHIGWVTSYLIEGDTTKLAVGIDIPEEKYRGGGNGRIALECWMNYLFTSYGQPQLYTQTWSGNGRMIKLAEKLGFQESKRKVGMREVRGALYDAITYEVTRERFYEGRCCSA
ncbi:MAG: family acetyltransferase [Paenibacillaceae bacterium]|jgi:RimJ/RimL family protein N-acetyltransferase|nr:family acetyltransferase [Paenibacillaceae bacterium]